MKKQILQRLPESCPWRDSLLWFDSIDSTNTRAKELGKQGAPHGTILIADHQTGGRGRLGRNFLSPAGSGIYLSVILRPGCAPGALMHLTCAAAVAMCEAVEAAAGFRPGIKWTNDLVYRGRKLAGILTELSLTARGTVDYAIVGVGINCCQRITDFAEEIQGMACSLAMFADSEIDRSQVAAAMIEALWQMDQTLLTDKPRVMDSYRADCITVGKEVSLLRGDGNIRHGRAVAVDDDGALLVEFSPGVTEIVNSGEISVRGMYGYT